MCQISTSIKFCTCDLEEEKNLPDNYWMLYRYNPDKQLQVIGEVRLPLFMTDENYVANRRSITRILNLGTAFDRDMSFQENDVLEVRIKSEPYSLEYEFRFVKSRWKSDSVFSLDLINEYDEVIGGEIQNALKVSK